jgi:hypothetical protein
VFSKIGVIIKKGGNICSFLSCCLVGNPRDMWNGNLKWRAVYTPTKGVRVKGRNSKESNVALAPNLWQKKDSYMPLVFGVIWVRVKSIFFLRIRVKSVYGTNALLYGSRVQFGHTYSMM